jgi:hypothetical protein
MTKVLEKVILIMSRMVRMVVLDYDLLVALVQMSTNTHTHTPELGRSTFWHLGLRRHLQKISSKTISK